MADRPLNWTQLRKERETGVLGKRFYAPFNFTGQEWVVARGTLASRALVQDRLYLTPILLTNDPIDRFVIEVATAAPGSTLRVGIYDSNEITDRPRTLLTGSEAVQDSTTTGVKEITISVPAPAAGLGWLAVAAQGGAPNVGGFPGVRTDISHYYVSAVTNGADVDDSATEPPGSCLIVNGVNGALPASLDATAWAAANREGAPLAVGYRRSNAI